MADDDGKGDGPPSVDLSWLPEGAGPLADGVYDAIVMGTGLKVRMSPSENEPDPASAIPFV